jgi:hypothetical protein
MRQLAGHYVEDFLSLDSRLLRSVLPLLIRPGALTREYLDGRRNSFIRPLRLYLLTSLIFFAAFRLNFDPSDTVKVKRGGETVALSELSDGEREKLKDIARDAIARGDHDVADGKISANDSIVVDLTDSSGVQFDLFRVPWWPRLDQWLQERESHLESMEMAELGPLVLDEIIRQAPKAIFLLLPAIALMLKLLYFRRSRFYMEHFIFALHWHSFLFLLFTLNVFLPWDWMRGIIIFSSPLYLLLALRRYYAQGWVRTVIKHQLMMGSYLVLLPVMTAILAISAALRI